MNSNRVPRGIMAGIDKTTTVVGKELWNATGSTTIGIAYINPNSTGVFGTRLQNIAGAYSEFRFKYIKFKFMPYNLNTNTGFLSIGYSKVPVLATSGETTATIMSYAASKLLTAYLTVPDEWHLAPAVLNKGIQPWFSCNNGDPITTNAQGSIIYLTATSTFGILAEVQFEVQFRGAAPSASLN